MNQHQVDILRAAQFVLDQLTEQQIISGVTQESGVAMAAFYHASKAIAEVFVTAAIYLQDPIADAATNAKAAEVGGRA